MKFKLKKFNLKALSISSLAVCLIFFGAALIFNLSAPSVYAVSNAWNLVKDGSNILNFQWSTGPNSMSITSGGNVGIGTTSPGKKLDVKGTGTDGLRLQRSSGGQDTELIFANEIPQDKWFMHFDGAGTENLFMYPSGPTQNLILQANEAGTAYGKVGIGTTNPSWSLDVLGPPTGAAVARISGSGAQSSYFLLASNGLQSELWNPANGDLWMNLGGIASGVFKMIRAGADGTNSPNTLVLNSGNVGIGTAAPTGKLSVQSTTVPASQVGQVNLYDSSAMTADVGGLINFGGNYTGTTTTTWAAIQGAKANATDGNASGYLRFFTRNVPGVYAERMRIDSTGNVGIGTTAPSARLVVGGGAAGTGRFDGGVGINGYQPAGCGAGFGLCVGGSSGGQSIWNNTSDARLKKNITTIPNALEKVMALRGVYFDFKDMEGVYKTLPKNRQVGFIAQEVEPILPEVVTAGSDGIKMLGYGSVTALLTEAIKEQQLEIEQLKLEIEQLKNR